MLCAECYWSLLPLPHYLNFAVHCQSDKGGHLVPSVSCTNNGVFPIWACSRSGCCRFTPLHLPHLVVCCGSYFSTFPAYLRSGCHLSITKNCPSFTPCVLFNLRVFFWRQRRVIFENTNLCECPLPRAHPLFRCKVSEVSNFYHLRCLAPSGVRLVPSTNGLPDQCHLRPFQGASRPITLPCRPYATDYRIVYPFFSSGMSVNS